MEGIGLPHLLIMVLILLIFFGPSRLPALGQSIGKAIKGFKDGMNETHNEVNKGFDTQDSRPAQIANPNEDALNQKKEEKSNQNNS